MSEYLGYQQQSLGRFPQELLQLAYQALEKRKAKLASDKDLVSSLGYKVRQ